MAPLGGRFAGLAQRRRQLRTQRLQAAVGLRRPGPAGLRPGLRPYGLRPNPVLSFWTQQLRRGISAQLQWVALYSRELKALDSVLGGPNPPVPRPWRGGALGRGRLWGAGSWPNADVMTPYSALDASADVTADPTTVDVSSDVPPDTSVEPMSPDDDLDDTGDRKPVPHAKLFAVFEFFDKKHRHDERYFTDDLYPDANRVYDELKERGYGIADGYERLKGPEVHSLYDRYVHHEALKKTEGRGERGDRDRDKDHQSDQDRSRRRPDTSDLVEVFERLYHAHKELTQDRYPYVDDVNEDLGEAYRHVDAERVERAFDSHDAKEIKEKWVGEEDREGDFDENKEKRPTNSQLIAVFRKLTSDDLTRAGYPRENLVNRNLGKGLQAVDAARIKRVFDSSDAREVADKLRKGQR
jgi:hypothetical protein